MVCSWSHYLRRRKHLHEVERLLLPVHVSLHASFTSCHHTHECPSPNANLPSSAPSSVPTSKPPTSAPSGSPTAPSSAPSGTITPAAGNPWNGYQVYLSPFYASEVSAAAAAITDAPTAAKALSVAKIPTFTWFGESQELLCALLRV